MLQLILGRMEFYHFKKSYFRIPVNMKSINPIDTEWFLLHINLSKTKQQKKVSEKILDFQKHLPIGLLLYGPGLEIDTLLPPNIEMELATIHFHFSFLDTYFENWKRVKRCKCPGAQRFHSPRSTRRFQCTAWKRWNPFAALHFARWEEAGNSA